MTTTIPRRLGAAALAAATIATGLGFATPATASPTTTGTTPVTTTGTTPVTLEDDEVTRLVGPLALIESAETAYGLSVDPDALRTKSPTTIEQALAASDYLSVPALGQTGPVTGIGDKADRCLSWGAATELAIVPCTGANQQNFTWATVPTLEGATHGLAPADTSNRAVRARGEGTYTHLRTGNDRRPMVLTSLAASRTLTADVTVNRASSTATITGVATSGATVSAEGATPVTADATTGAYTLTVPGLQIGDNEITVTQTLPDGTPYGETTVTATVEDITRLVGPLALLNNSTTAYGLSFDADALRTRTTKSIQDALADSEYVSVPALGTTGPVTGVGAEANKCLQLSQQLIVATCNGASNQRFTWTTVPTLQGENTGLSPASDTGRALAPRAAWSFTHMPSGDFRRPIVLSSMAAVRTLTADVSVDQATKTATITGVATSGATISAEGAIPATADATTGAYTLTVPALPFGDNKITVTQTLPNGTPFGTAEVTATLVSPVEGVTVDPVTLDRGAATPVEVQVTHSENYTSQTGTVTMTAPEGTRFAEGQTTVSAQLKHPGGEWRNDNGPHTLQDGVLSEDGRTMTWQYRGTTSGYAVFPGSLMRWYPTLVVDRGAPASTGDVTFTFEGTGTPGGDFRATGTSPVVIEEAPIPSELAVTNPNAEQIAAGYTPNTSYTFEGTGNPSSEIVVRNSKGLELGRETVTDTGDWTWTRENMGTYTWIIDFIQDEGTPTEQRQRIASFKPVEITPGDPGTPIQVTNPTPAQIAAGYTPNAAYTFEGTGTTGSTITIQNAKGLELGDTTVTNGTWSWTRTNMGEYNWTLDFVQDKGLPTEQKTRISNFKPGQPEAPAPGVLAVTNPTPAQIDAGYTPNTSYTFEGTGTTGSTITIQNAKGLVFGTEPVTDGTWTWTRTNMGEFNWTLDFIQDKGTATEKTVRVSGFKPVN